MADENFYNKQVGAAYWFVTHKQMIKSIISAILIAVFFLLVALNLYLLIFNFGIYNKKYSAFVDNLVSTPAEYVALRQSKLPQAINIAQINTLPNVNNTDIVAEISNPNFFWYATFNYQFQLGDRLTDSRKGYILPRQSKKLIDLNVENGNNVSNLIFTDLKWYREINYQALEAEKFDIEIKNINLIPPTLLGLTDKVQISRVTFDVVNNSPFNYANVALQIYLLNKGQPVAVSQIYSGALKTNETKSYQVNFFQTLPKVTDISIIPEINILDPDSFLKF